MDNNKSKHLEFIQNIVARMAKNSFLLKGWTVTLLGALFAINSKDLDYQYLIVSAVVLALFWFMDGFYYSRERLFIKLYDHVRLLEQTDFSMDVKPFQGCFDWINGVFSRTILPFYGVLLLVLAGVLIKIIIK